MDIVVIDIGGNVSLYENKISEGKNQKQADSVKTFSASPEPPVKKELQATTKEVKKPDGVILFDAHKQDK